MQPFCLYMEDGWPLLLQDAHQQAVAGQGGSSASTPTARLIHTTTPKKLSRFATEQMRTEAAATTPAFTARTDSATSQPVARAATGDDSAPSAAGGRGPQAVPPLPCILGLCISAQKGSCRWALWEGCQSQLCHWETSGSSTSISRLTDIIANRLLVGAASCLTSGHSFASSPEISRQDSHVNLRGALYACSAGDSFSSSTGTGRLASRTSADYSNMGLAESVAQQQEEASEQHQERDTEEPPEANGSHMGPMEKGMASWRSSADAVSVMPAAEHGPSGRSPAGLCGAC